MITNEILNEMWDDTTSTTKATNVEVTKKLLRNVVYTMSVISKLEDHKTFISVVMEPATVKDGKAISAVTERFSINDYVIDPAFKMFVVPRAVKIEASPMWKNLKSEVVDTICISDGEVLTPDAFTKAQLLILASVGRKFSPSLRMGDATIAQPLSQVKSFIIDGRVYCSDRNTTELPIYFKADFANFIDLDFSPTTSTKAYIDRVKMAFIATFSSWNGGTNKTKSKTSFKPKGNKSTSKSSSSNDAKADGGADNNAPNGEVNS